MAGSLDPDTPLADLDWAARGRLTALAKLGISTVGDLLRHYPRRYEDRRSLDHFPDAAMDVPVCIGGVVASTALKRFGHRRGGFEATIENGTGSAFAQPVLCRWFNMPYMQNILAAGRRVVIFGKPKMKGRQVVMDHPEYEIIEEGDDSLHMRRVVPIHPAGEGITPRALRTLIHRALGESALESIGFLGGAGLGDALRAIHFPESEEAAVQARRRLALDEFYALQVVVQMRRQAWGREAGVAKIAQGKHLEAFFESLPFELTTAQRAAIGEVSRDMIAPSRMHRLLQGDVGSGKTLVALAAAIHAIEAGFPAAIMAPTQILAEQHHATFSRFLEPLGIPILLRTGHKKTDSATLFDRLPPVFVGTHALLFEEDAGFQPGLVVIDEQHKFGVLQRSRLAGLSSRPDLLVMTATPIPRTLAQTLYGDLDVSLLDEKPPGRGAVKTVLRPEKKLPEATAFLREHLAAGRQAYIVYPLIEESEKLAAKAAASEVEKWRSFLSPHSVGLLHGRIESDEKERMMREFRDGRLSVLVSTTVIEVGVDVSNATLLFVENAERFGLAQLHQLRGRIGRGERQSFCVLLHSQEAPQEALEKLAVLEHTNDGFVIAEEDLRLRGPGNILGTEQTGLPPLKLADLAGDARLMEEATRLARATLKEDPLLEKTAHHRLRSLVQRTLGHALAASA